MNDDIRAEAAVDADDDYKTGTYSHEANTYFVKMAKEEPEKYGNLNDEYLKSLLIHLNRFRKKARKSAFEDAARMVCSSCCVVYLKENLEHCAAQKKKIGVWVHKTGKASWDCAASYIWETIEEEGL